ncbi:hypothetical protein PPL_06379 [Heterostelium album PN500]|uniref:Uncharacterized protein n=1 Tax=Heterostelium pallidum (strain ATCC 26659 / Pp 5 / PN500) TaxID=670386 RepID=D3BD01_HETP5|nr:hypothetical protein PPL_06379 [Heterostelium album PN500]EFA80793.1 hypothetical protein PPL_06379 [Heterostelium album PN500]|eukprot:XP_020432912.1 hypothetical protein PPL_06379 [Heterostelium album PN500]
MGVAASFVNNNPLQMHKLKLLNFYISKNLDVVNLNWVPSEVCNNINSPCNFTSDLFWGGSAPVPGDTLYNINIDASSFGSPQYIELILAYNPEQIVLFNLTGPVTFTVSKVAEFNNTVVNNGSTVIVNANLKSEQTTFTNGSLLVHMGSTELNGVTLFNEFSTFIVDQDATLILEGQTDLYCQLQMLGQTVLNMVYNHYPVVFHAGVVSNFKLLFQQSISFKGVSNLTLVDGHNGGEFVLLPGAEIYITGDLYITDIGMYPGSLLDVNTEQITIVLGLTLGDTTNSATLVANSIEINQITSRGTLNVQSPNIVFNDVALINQFNILGNSIIVFNDNVTIEDIQSLGNNNEITLIANQSSSATIAQVSQEGTIQGLTIQVNVNASLLIPSAFATTGDIDLYGACESKKSLTAGSIFIRESGLLNLDNNQLNANLFFYGGQFNYNKATTLNIGGSLNLNNGAFSPTSDMIIAGSFVIAQANLQLINTHIQVLTSMQISHQTNIQIQQSFQPGSNGVAPIEVLGTVSLDGQINIKFQDQKSIDYSQNYNIISSQDQITGNFYGVVALQATEKYEIKVSTGKPPNYAYLSFEKPKSGHMASWKIGLIVVSIMVVMVAVGFGWLYYKRNDGYLRLNN